MICVFVMHPITKWPLYIASKKSALQNNNDDDSHWEALLASKLKGKDNDT